MNNMLESIDMNISLITMRPYIGQTDKNLKKMEDFLEKTDAEFCVFGEATLMGYRCQDELRSVAEPLDGPSVKTLQQLAKKKNRYILFGMPLADDHRQGIIYNAAVLLYPTGEIGVYKKWFLPNFGPFQEKLFFDQGETLPVFQTKYGRIGVCICYDLFFSELTKSYALQGADIIICISASPITSKRFFEPLFPARAIEYTTFFLFTNLVGPQDDLVFWGGSQAFDPLGNLIKKAPEHEESVITFEIDVSKIPTVRAHRPTIRDTRPELFHDLYQLSRE
jgi:predicted amidohydrolase